MFGSKISRFAVAALLLFSMGGIAHAQHFAQHYDVVIAGGRVIDPETGLDAVRHIGISGDRIDVVSTQPLSGATVIDASGKIVVPGFVDLHTHGTTTISQQMQLLDGVTTALELELGTVKGEALADLYADGTASNFGASAGYMSARMLVKNGIILRSGTALPMPAGLKGIGSIIDYAINGFEEALAPTYQEKASADEISQINRVLAEELDKGALGIGLTLDYMSEAINEAELRAVFELAAARDVPLYIHIRRGINGDPAGLREVIDLAKQTGAAIHICHITHNAMVNLDLFLDEITVARNEGVDITVEVLPFEAGSTNIGAAVFRRDWRTIYGIDYGDVQRADTGAWFTEESFKAYQRDHPDAPIIHHYLNKGQTRRALSDPEMIIVSDLISITTLDKKVPPHNTAFTRVLDLFVKQEQIISLPDAISRMTLKPAQRLQKMAPAFARKGRLQTGADADIVVLDWDRLAHRASYQDPYAPTVGVEYVLVNGQVAVSNGALVAAVKAGRLLTSLSE